MSKRRITLSTAGVVPMIERCGEESGVMLAISLHAVRDDVRDRLVPLNRKYPIANCSRPAAIIPACRMPGGSPLNMSCSRASMTASTMPSELVRLLKGIPAKINLIPFNPWPGTPYECSDWETIEKVRRLDQQGRLCQPDPHTARPRYHGRLRPAQICLGTVECGCGQANDIGVLFPATQVKKQI